MIEDLADKAVLISGASMGTEAALACVLACEPAP